MYLGNVLATFSFLLWGITPLYYQYLPGAPMDELLAVRIIASVPVTAIALFFVSQKWPNITALFKDKKSFLYSTLAALLMCVSWSSFTWAITNDRVIDASLGFFISPLTIAAMGVWGLKEKLSSGKVIALFLGLIGVLYQVACFGQVPYIALSMAFFFTLYSWCKKQVSYDWCSGLFVECLVLAPFALIYILGKDVLVGAESLNSGVTTFFLYLGSAPVTLAPLVFFSLAIRWTRMSTIGFLQYLEPTLQFVLAVFVFGEVFDDMKVVSFGLIWIGLLFIIVEAFISRFTVLQSFSLSLPEAIEKETKFAFIEPKWGRKSI
ncbi:EamA family transporter RarD [Vibrio viridaestus]|uniref:EamA family transporter RarD n=1 Tax=Vibrio viridaestus TaxID=2487322 RepID=A0A3N9TEQ8_9VIBR|nr:EamA family transporter RarD [Vibrio viridaestus]RQW62354.1 EamA family transporter RarD [Vibrio viridaestus]